MFRFMSDMFDFAKEQRAKRAEEAEKARIAKVFNDCYTFRNVYKYGHACHHAWMCPICNKIYSTTEYSFLTYPACCTYPAGQRCLEGIRDR